MVVKHQPIRHLGSSSSLPRTRHPLVSESHKNRHDIINRERFEQSRRHVVGGDQKRETEDFLLNNSISDISSISNASSSVATAPIENEDKRETATGSQNDRHFDFSLDYLRPQGRNGNFD